MRSIMPPAISPSLCISPPTTPAIVAARAAIDGALFAAAGLAALRLGAALRFAALRFAAGRRFFAAALRDAARFAVRFAPRFAPRFAGRFRAAFFADPRRAADRLVLRDDLRLVAMS